MVAPLQCRCGERAVDLRPDPEKKSAQLLDNGLEVAGTSLSIEHKSIFFLGGFQIVSDASRVKVYLEKDGTETYLTTARGIRQEGQFKALCVVPGGPRPVHRARLDLEFDGESCTVHSLRVTARIPDASADTKPIPASGPPAGMLPPGMPPGMLPPGMSHGMLSDMSRIPPGMPMVSGGTLPVISPASNAPSIDQEDLNSAMAAMTFTARQTEDRLRDLIQRLHGEGLQAQKQTQTMILKQQQTVLQQSALLMEQRTIIEEQREMINALQSDQRELRDMLVKHVANNSSNSVDAATETTQARSSTDEPVATNCDPTTPVPAADDVSEAASSGVPEAIEGVQTNTVAVIRSEVTIADSKEGGPNEAPEPDESSS